MNSSRSAARRMVCHGRCACGRLRGKASRMMRDRPTELPIIRLPPSGRRSHALRQDRWQTLSVRHCCWLPWLCNLRSRLLIGILRLAWCEMLCVDTHLRRIFLLRCLLVSSRQDLLNRRLKPLLRHLRLAVLLLILLTIFSALLFPAILLGILLVTLALLLEWHRRRCTSQCRRHLLRWVLVELLLRLLLLRSLHPLHRWGLL